MLTDEQIKHMAGRFLNWRLPKDFRPDNGISYTRPNYHPSVDATPYGTNLFDAEQAEAMLRHMVGNMPACKRAIGDDVLRLDEATESERLTEHAIKWRKEWQAWTQKKLTGVEKDHLEDAFRQCR